MLPEGGRRHDGKGRRAGGGPGGRDHGGEAVPGADPAVPRAEPDQVKHRFYPPSGEPGGPGVLHGPDHGEDRGGDGSPDRRVRSPADHL